YSADREEPPHIHVERETSRAKFWLEPVWLRDSTGFGRAELRRVERLVDEHAVKFLGAWHDFFTN
ncbi:MAG: DUF4160 domain-containing protein, partial [Gemmatimonadetes bacterium]|nr:DUF4160 domain-containing protein [Gemmatimonadota bacterium]